jgi:biotin carboxylase
MAGSAVFSDWVIRLSSIAKKKRIFSMSKKIMILGAGLMQRPAILAARKNGYEAVVVDGNPSAVCVPLADRFEPIDLKDTDALIHFAGTLCSDTEEDSLAGVFTAGTDFSASVACIAAHMGLPGHTADACLNASDKIRMRHCFAQSGVPSPGYIEITNAQIGSLSRMAENGLLEFPKVVKPVDNMGARGCRLVRSRGEFLSSVQNAVAYSRSGRAIFEDYMDGPEFSIDSVVWNGTLTITGFADRHIQYPPYFIETGHTMPTICDESVKLELIAAFSLGIKALGLTCGVAKADIKYTKNGPMIGEIAARLSGGYMSGWTYPYASDCDLTEQALLVAAGKTPGYLLNNRLPVAWMPHASSASSVQPFELFEIPCRRVSAERAWMSIPGKISSITGLEAAGMVAGVRDVLPRSNTGSTVVFPRNNVEKCGNVIAAAAERDTAVSAAEKAVASIVLRLEPHNAATDSFLRGVPLQDESGFPPPAYSALQETVKRQILALPGPAAGAPVYPLLPEDVKKSAGGMKDWNYRTIEESLHLFDLLCADHRAVNGMQFWSALIQGGVQGILYAADCAGIEK